MGKRAASGKGGVVIAQEIRKLVEANNAISGPGVIAALKEKFPSVKFNEASVQVAFANARKKLGLSKTVRPRPIGGARRGRPPGRPKAVATAATSAPAGNPTISLLQAAKELLQHCKGDANAAIAALKQVSSLQMK